MLLVKNVSFSRSKLILDEINFKLNTGSILGIVGPSGAGKSTLLKIIAGLLDSDNGKIVLDGETVLGPKDKLIPGNPDIQLVNQDFSLDLYHSVYENLIVKTSHLSQEIRIHFIGELLEVLELNHLKNQKAVELSGGEQQRLALARAMALEPKVLLLDEPFAHLDAHIKRKVSNYILELNKIRKTTLIIVSHDGQEILHLADQIAFFNEGKFERISNGLDFYNEPRNYNEGLYFGELNQIKIGNKSILFRPNQYEMQETKNSIQIEVKFRAAYFFGPFKLGLFKYKNQRLFLQEKETKNLREISTIFVDTK